MRFVVMLISLLALLSVMAAVVSVPSVAAADDRILTAADLAGFPSPEADLVVAYGADPLQFGELRLPTGPGPHPVMILVHGGCWLADYDIAHIRNLAAAVANAGIATWALEYRRVGDAGGGWPGTFTDIAAGARRLRDLAAAHDLDLTRVIAAGHSAGGHLALWLANMPEEMRGPDPIALQGVLALAPAADLEYLHRQKVCGHVIDGLMGGGPADVPDRYRAASMVNRVPLTTPQQVILGAHDAAGRPVGERYVRVAKEAGAPIRVTLAPRSGHFEMIDPRTDTFDLVLAAARALLAPDP